MNKQDKEYKEICSICFKDKAFILQEVLNAKDVKLYCIVDSNYPADELLSCAELDLGNMLQFLINNEKESEE